MAKLLVVDDDANTVSALRSLLQEDGHDVDAFTTGVDALVALSQKSFDAILADFEMPDVTGGDVVRYAREHQPTACVYISTAKVGLDEIAGVCHIFDKPLDYESVARAVSECRRDGGPGGDSGCYFNRLGDDGRRR